MMVVLEAYSIRGAITFDHAAQLGTPIKHSVLRYFVSSLEVLDVVFGSIGFLVNVFYDN